MTTPTDSPGARPEPLPTPAEAMRNAVAEAGNRRWQAADTWLRIAAELRSAEPSSVTHVFPEEVMRAMGAAPSPERYAPQDIVLRACHHAVPVVSLSPTGRWWHPGSKTWCDDTAPADFPEQVRFAPSTTVLDDRPAVLADTDTRLRVIGDVPTQVIERPIDCKHCPDRVERYGIEGWWHTFTHEEACGPSDDGVPRGTYAYPRDLTQVTA